MGKKGGGWQSLSMFIANHMHEEVNDDRLDRALETMSGHLTRNPRYVVDQFTVESGGKAEGGAISPKGTVAVVLGEYRGREGTAIAKRLRLLTRWPDGRRELRDLGERSPRVPVSVVFPEGSDEPAVIVEGELVVWGKGELGLRVDGRPVRGMSCLTLFGEGDMRFGAWIDAEGFACQFPFSFPGRAMGGTGGLRGTTRWLGLVGGSLARITVEGDRDVLYWRDIVVRTPYSDIIQSSIGVSKGGIQFVVKSGERYIAFWADGGTPFDTEVPKGKLYFVDNRIFVVTRLLEHDVRLHEFRTDRFTPVGDTNERMGMGFPDDADLIILDGDTYILTHANANRPDSRMTVQLGEVGGFSRYRGNGEDTMRVFSIHGNLASVRKDWTLWVDKNTIFPLYNTSYGNLTAVEDDRGKAIMSWAFTDGTFHVLRYPLPSR